MAGIYYDEGVAINATGFLDGDSREHEFLHKAYYMKKGLTSRAIEAEMKTRSKENPREVLESLLGYRVPEDVKPQYKEAPQFSKKTGLDPENCWYIETEYKACEIDFMFRKVDDEPCFSEYLSWYLSNGCMPSNFYNFPKKEKKEAKKALMKLDQLSKDRNDFIERFSYLNNVKELVKETEGVKIPILFRIKKEVSMALKGILYL